MSTSALKYFTVNYKQIIIDEIALEGLEGVGLDLLWRRVGYRLSTEITEKMRVRFWEYVVNSSSIEFYKIPEPLPYVEIIDRFELVDDVTGHLKEPEDYLDGPYEYNSIEHGEHGSSKYYDVRTLIPKTKLRDKSYGDIVKEYGDKIVMVASIEERWCALAGHKPVTYLAQMTHVHYCLLELVGKARGNGQMTIGKTNLNKIIKDPKTLFYNRKYLREIDLIRTDHISQVVAGKALKALLVRLKRFHQPSVLTMPKKGALHNVVSYLLQQPDYSEKTEVIVKKGLITQKQNRRLQKTVNIFNFEERMVTADDKAKKTTVNLKRKFIFLSSKSDESSESDEETQEPPLKCQYKVGVSLMRQAYERFLDAGLEGLTQVQLAQLLGIEFYISRGICRLLRLRNIVREYLEDKGKQRTARFIAIAATGEMDVRYAEEKKKFFEYLKQHSSESTSMDTEAPQEVSTPEDIIPLKKLKLDPSNTEAEIASETAITEIKVLDGFESVKSLGTFKKNPTLRQLTFANGVLKVLQEKQCVCGYHTLSNLASKEINEPPMDTKALKSFIQKLVTDGHIKMYKLKWPAIQKYSVLICAPHIKITDPLVKAKYKEICMRALTNKKVSIKREPVEAVNPPLSQFSYPRYMKIQKLHEFIIRFAYFDEVPPESHSLPPGFVSIVDFIQEVTIEFVINNMGSMGMTEINQLINASQLQMKLKDAPPHIYKALMRSNTLQNAIRLNLKVLAMLGLIQLVNQAQTSYTTGAINYTSFLFFVNRRAKLLDTSGIWPRKNEEKTTEKSYNFKTFDDVTDYWNDVYQISTNTVIELANRGRRQLNPPLRTEDEVIRYDNGTRYGDGNGPCGFDSCFYMEIPRLWRTYYMRPLKSHVSAKKKIHVKIPKIKLSKKKTEAKLKASAKLVPEKVPNEKLTRKRNESTLQWSKEEDLILTMCKAAITILSPASQPGSLIVRNLVAKDLLALRDPKKTKGTCHRRAKTLESNLTLVHEKQCIINELRRRRHLIQKYEGLLKKIRLIYSTNMTKFINKSRIPMMELVWLITQVMRSKSYTQKVPCVALDLEDFHNHFTIVPSTANKLCNMYKVPDHACLKEAIVLTIMQTLNGEFNSDMGKKIYQTFKEYPETSLRTAVEHLRKCGAISAKEKIFNNQMRIIDLEDIVQSSYKISAFYQRKWQNRLNSDFVDKLAVRMSKEQGESEVKGSADFNCVYCEMHASGIVDLMPATMPVITDPIGAPIMPEEINVLTIDTKYKLKPGTLTWRHKSNSVKISEVYNDLNLDNSLKYLNSYTSLDKKEIKNMPMDMKNPIVSHLFKKGETGATYSELKDILGLDDKTLTKKLQHLETRKIAKRVGYYENVIVLVKFIQPWSAKIGDKYLLPTPWQTLQGKAKLEVFFKWCSAVMNVIFDKPGCSIVFIADKCEYITYKAAQDICMFLDKYECIKLRVVKYQPLDIFSDEDEEPEFMDFNPYEAPEHILAFTVKDSLTKYCYVRKVMMEKFN